MIIRIVRYIFLITALLHVSSAGAQEVLDSLKRSLAEAKTPADSVTLLYNIFDCTPYAEQGEALEQLYAAAVRSGDTHVINDVLKISANYNYLNDSIQQVLLERAESLPDTDEKKSTLLFLRVRDNAKQVRSLPEDKREAKLREYLAMHTGSETYDTYERIEYLFFLCAYLRLSTEGELLTKYFQELQTLIDKLPARDISLKSLFYTQAANSYLSNEMFPEAVAANHTLLEIIKELERQYDSKGRLYRNYDRSKYICYRRLLRCHDFLEPSEVDDLYEKIQELVKQDPGLRSDFENRHRSVIYYMMAKKRYAEVIPLIRKQLEDKNNTREEQTYLVEALLKASDAVDDKESQLVALQLSNQLLKKRIENKASESYKELQIVYEVNDLKQANDELVMANQQIVLDRHKEQLIYALAGLVVLILLLSVVYFFYHRARRLTANLSDSNAMIVSERDALKRAQKDLIKARDKAKASDRIKTDFVNNMSHELRTPLEAIVEYSSLIADCADEDKRDYIKRFADVISLNADLLLTIANDVLEIPSLENAKMSVSFDECSSKEICEHVVGSMEKHVKPEVRLIFAATDSPDVKIHTDAQRVEQVLLNLLKNAVNFTERGTVVLDYKLSDDGKFITFSVTDTGIGIPLGKEEIIFSRFEKLNSATPGSGLGLYISRLLAGLLKGELKLDAEYRKGARFVFTIPVNAKAQE